MDYDVLILGGDIIGCAIAYELSKYNLNIALIEKDYDIADDISLINTEIIYNGIETEHSITSKMEYEGNVMMDKITSKFNIPFKRMGSLMIAKTKEEEIKLDKIYKRAVERGIKDVYLIQGVSVFDIEPKLGEDITKAIYSKNTGVICPYDLALAYGEIAFDNHVNFKLEEEVLEIKKSLKGFNVITNKNKFTCKILINTIPEENYNIYKDRKIDKEKCKKKKYLKYFLCNKTYNNFYSNMIFNLSDDEDNIYAIPTVSGKTIYGLNTDKDMDNTKLINKASSLIGNLNKDDVNTFYRSSFYCDPIVIDDSCIDTGYIKIKGKHYGIVTMTPAIAQKVCETVVGNLNCKLKKDFIDKRREYYRFKELSNEERQNIIELDNRYGKIICVCKKITEGEIIDAISRPLGARTVEGIKRRTGAAFGKCKGSQCLNKIVSILARETNKKVTEIVKDSKKSKIVPNRIKEFDSM